MYLSQLTQNLIMLPLVLLCSPFWGRALETGSYFVVTRESTVKFLLSTECFLFLYINILQATKVVVMETRLVMMTLLWCECFDSVALVEHVNKLCENICILHWVNYLRQKSYRMGFLVSVLFLMNFIYLVLISKVIIDILLTCILNLF